MRRAAIGLWALWIAISAATVAWVLPAFGQPGIESTIEWQWYCEGRLECSNAEELRVLRQHYLSHARVRLGAEQRLPNGVAWRLLIDAGSGLAMPRLTWMPDRPAMLAANRLFDAIQARRLGSTENRIWQPRVEVTYASARYVSYVEIIAYEDERRLLNTQVIGRVLDLKAGKILSAEPCPRREDDEWTGYPRFSFEGLIETCDGEKISRFMTLSADEWTSSVAAAENARDSQALACLKAMEDHWHPAPVTTLALTSAGLAIYHSSNFQDTQRDCVIPKNRLYPTIVPYRELASLLIPGPLKDELLASGAPLGLR